MIDAPPRSTIRIFTSQSFETFRSALASDEFGVGGTNSTVASPSFLNHSDRFVNLLSRRSAAFQDLGRYSGLSPLSSFSRKHLYAEGFY